VTAKVFEFGLFEKTPQGFNGVEFRGVRGQANQPETLVGFVSEETLDLSAAMSRSLPGMWCSRCRRKKTRA